MKEILCMIIGAAIAIFASFAVPEKYQEKFILGFSLCNDLCNIKIQFV